MSKLKKFISSLITVCVLTIGLSSTANADVSNVICQASSNTIHYNHNGSYNHGWVYVNGNYRGDFWTISSGSRTFITSGSRTFITSVSSGDHVMILFYNGSYGQTHGNCF